MTVAIISSVTSILVCILTCVFGIKQSQMKATIEKSNAETVARGERRKKESLLSMKLARANTQLTIGVAMALKNGHANGEIEDGLAMVHSANEEYEEFLAEMANEHLQ